MGKNSERDKGRNVEDQVDNVWLEFFIYFIIFINDDEGLDKYKA